MRRDSHRKKLDRLADVLVDDILQASDEEIFSETIAEGKSVKAETDSIRVLLKNAEMKVAKELLATARKAVAQQKEADQSLSLIHI